jgi:type II secretory pathway pseudopilin PulG
MSNYQSSAGYPPPKPAGSGFPTVLIVILVLVMLVPALICILMILVALLLPAVHQAREAARRTETSQDLRQIGVALLAYHDTHKSLPPAFQADSQGQPGVSWRTAILPFLEQKPLYDRYNSSAAWNDPANAAVADAALDVYESQRDPSQMPRRTNYVVVRGAGTVFPGNQSRTLGDMKRGMGNTILVVEIHNSDIAWAEPRDLDLDSLTTDPSAANSVNLNAGVVVLAGDGSVRTLRSISLEELKALLLSEGSATMP